MDIQVSTSDKTDSSLIPMPHGRTEVHGAQLAAEVDIQRTLVEVSHHLISAEHVDFDKILALVGTAIGAQGLYLILLPSDDLLIQGNTALEDETLVACWYREGLGASERGPYEALPWRQPLLAAYPGRQTNDTVVGSSVFPIPFFSPRERLLGYLGVVCATSQCRAVAEESSLIALLRDFLVTYLNQQEAERALGESEGRWHGLVDHHPEPILITLDGEVVFINGAGLEALGVSDLSSARGHSMRAFIPAEQYEAVERQWERLRQGREAETVVHDLRCTDGTQRVVESTSTSVSYGGRWAVQTVLRDITERLEQEDRHDAFMQTISEAVWRVDLDHAVGIHTFPSFQVDHVLGCGFLAECNEAFARLWGHETSARLVGGRLHTLLPTLSRSLLEAFIFDGYQLRDRKIEVSQQDGSTRRFVINALGRVEGDRLVRIWGSCREAISWADERHILTMLEQQREGIGRDLHDGVGQMLTSVRLLSSTLAAQYQEEDDDRVQLAQKVARFAGEAAVQMRYFYRGLMPPHIEQRSLAEALSDLAFDTDAMPGISCTFLYTLDDEVCVPETKLQLYRIAQEATNNALKHAKARTIQICLGRRDGEIVLQIRDDGVGFDERQCTGKTLGLRSMAHRARSIEATLHIGSHAKEGTTVTCVVTDRADTLQ